MLLLLTATPSCLVPPVGEGLRTKLLCQIKALLEEQVPRLAGFNIVRYLHEIILIIKVYILQCSCTKPPPLSLSAKPNSTAVIVVRLPHGQREWLNQINSVLEKHGGKKDRLHTGYSINSLVVLLRSVIFKKKSL